MLSEANSRVTENTNTYAGFFVEIAARKKGSIVTQAILTWNPGRHPIIAASRNALRLSTFWLFRILKIKKETATCL